MARLDIAGKRVIVDDEFLSLSSDQQNAVVEEIVGSFTPQMREGRSASETPPPPPGGTTAIAPPLAETDKTTPRDGITPSVEAEGSLADARARLSAAMSRPGTGIQQQWAAKATADVARASAGHLAGWEMDELDHFNNERFAASQGTSPYARDLNGKLVRRIAGPAVQTDTGIGFVDPATGDVMPAIRNRHVALQDPQSGRSFVYDRSEETDEGLLSSLGRLMAPATMTSSLRGVTSGVEAARRSQEAARRVQLAKDFDALKVTPTVPGNSESKFVHRVAEGVSGVPYSPLRPSLDKSLKETIAAAEETAANFGRARSADEAATQPVKGAFSRHLGTANPDAAFDEIWKRVTVKDEGILASNLASMWKLRRNVSQPEWENIGAAFIRRLGTSVDNATFSPAKFVSSFDKLKPEARNLLFGTSGNRDLQLSLERFARVAKAQVPVEKAVKNAGSAAAGYGTGSAGPMFEAFASGDADTIFRAMATWGTPHAAALFMNSPKAVDELTRAVLLVLRQASEEERLAQAMRIREIFKRYAERAQADEAPASPMGESATPTPPPPQNFAHTDLSPTSP